MRILFFSDHFRPEPSAPAAHVYERCRLWVEAGHQVTVIASAPNFPEGRVYPGYRNAWREIESMDGIRVVRVKTFITRNEGVFLRSLDYLSYGLMAFLQAFREPRPDVIISSSPHLFVAAAGVTVAACRRVPHVMEIRDLWPASLLDNTELRPGLAYRALEWLELLLYRRSRRLIALTPGISSDVVARGVPPEKVETVINAANLALFHPRAPDAMVLERYALHDRFVVGYIGTLGLSHGLENALRALDRLRATRVTLLLVGVGAAKAGLEQLARELELPNVVFVPRQLKEQVPAFWSVCSASLIHLKNSAVFRTAMPSKIFESMAMGLPIVYCGPDSPGAALVREKGAGVWVPPDDPVALGAALTALADDPVHRGRLAVASLGAAPEFSRERQAQATLAVLRRAVE